MWYTLVAVGFGAVIWGSYASPDWVQALVSSGSALSTVGFATPPNVIGQFIAFIEGGIGLFIVVFLLTFIPFAVVQLDLARTAARRLSCRQIASRPIIKVPS